MNLMHRSLRPALCAVAALASSCAIAGSNDFIDLRRIEPLHGDANAGKAKSTVCSACHGANGISIAPIYPNVAGQKEEYLVAQLKAFRDGSRQNPIMAPMAKGLTDTDIANISLYVSTLKP